jgi:dihydrofolate synthase/folylpolyglutamate synthase
MHDKGWRYALTGDGFTFLSTDLTHAFPKPNLQGEHQFANAATAIATLASLTTPHVGLEAMTRGLREASWPARLQRLTTGPLTKLLNGDSELWLDGGHNDSAGAALARQAAIWKEEDDKPLLVIYGMLTTKQADEFLQPLAPAIAELRGIAIPGGHSSMTAEEATATATKLHIKAVPAASAEDAITSLLSAQKAPVRVLITGSLYLAGHILRDHG